MEDNLVKNTLAFRFPTGAPSPSLVEIARFVKNLDAELDSMETTYKLAEEQCVCVKFKSLEAMKEAQAQIPEIVVFRYTNGEKVEIKMSVAGCYTRYVRIFDLPPEVPDSEIAAVLGRYGSVKRMIREKFPADLGLNMYTGVRGVYLDLKKPVPAALYFLNRKGRIFYEGLKQKCFLCKEEGHLKAGCPQKTKGKVEVKDKVLLSSATGEASGTTPSVNIDKGDPSPTQPSYSGVLCGVKPIIEKESVMANMVTLVSERNKPPALSEAASEHAVDEEVMDTEPEVDAEDGVTKGGVKRQHSTGGSTGETDDESAEGFTRVGGNRKSSRSVVKKVVMPLDKIASVPNPERKVKRSTSK